MNDTNLDSLFGGESERIGYKVSRPKDTRTYLKTMVAFANSQGGNVVFGVDDRTHEVVGIPSGEVPEEMDAVSNAIGDPCGEFGEKLHPTDSRLSGSLQAENGSQDIRSNSKLESDNKTDNKSDNKLESDITGWQGTLLELMKEDQGITQTELVSHLGIARSTLTARLAELQAEGVIRRAGARKNGHLEVLGG